MADNNTQQQPNNPQRPAPDQQQQQGEPRRDDRQDEAGRNPGGEANQGDTPRREQTDVERDA